MLLPVQTAASGFLLLFCVLGFISQREREHKRERLNPIRVMSIISLVDLSLENHKALYNLHDWQPLLQSLNCLQSDEERRQHQDVPLKGCGSGRGEWGM